MNRKLRNEELGRISVDEFKYAQKQSVIIVLDNVRSLHNVGSVFRTADAFLVNEIFLCGVTGTPPHKEIEKTALGATATVSWRYFNTTGEAIAYLKKQDYRICSVEQASGSVKLNEFSYDGAKTALVFGNEVYGVEQDVISASDTVIEIPQLGTKHSLNIAVSVGIVLWEMMRSRV